jgi:hypothetical protein
LLCSYRKNSNIATHFDTQLSTTAACQEIYSSTIHDIH